MAADESENFCKQQLIEHEMSRKSFTLAIDEIVSELRGAAEKTIFKAKQFKFIRNLIKRASSRNPLIFHFSPSGRKLFPFFPRRQEQREKRFDVNSETCVTT